MGNNAGATTDRATHTPGPWVYWPGTRNEGLVIGRIIEGDVDIPHALAGSEADARLIAAAPTMYDAIEDALVTFESIMDTVVYTSVDPDAEGARIDGKRSLDGLRAAIEKATGGES